MSHPSRMTVLSLAILGLSQYAFAQTEETVQLQDVHVIGYKIKKVGEETLNRQALDNGMVEDANDLVRYQAGVGVTAGGRSGSKGFAIRGQDGNRVAITMDGVAQPDYQASAVNNTYGYYPSARPSVEMDFMRSASIQKGADSWQVGSGALGGAVNFKTKEASDLIQEGNAFGAYGKSGYASKNNEWSNTFGLAYSELGLDALLMYSGRYGHETKNSGDGVDVWGPARGIPDPADHRQESWMAKLGYQFNDAHRVDFKFIGQDYHNDVNNKSFDQIFYPGASYKSRNTVDYAKRENYAVSYLYTPNSEYIDSIKAEVGKQINNSRAVTNSNGSVSDRRLDNHYQYANLQFLSQTFGQLGTSGEHRISVQAGFGKNDFLNTEITRGALSKGSFRPAKTTNWFISADDKIQLSDRLSGVLGVRYDQYRYRPDFDAQLSEGSPTDSWKPVKNRNISATTWLLGLDGKLDDTWTVKGKVSTGFRAPTSTELYARYHVAQSSGGPGGYGKTDGILIQSNPDLNPEKSINYELGLSGQGRYGQLNTSIYHSRYQDMIPDVGQLMGKEGSKLVVQMKNIDKTHVTGIDVDGVLYLDQVSALPEGWLLTGSASYAKGSSKTGQGLMSLQPFKAVLGFGYDHDKRWGAMSYLTYHGKRSGDNTMVQTLETMDAKDQVKNISFPYLNKSAFVVDATAYYNINKKVVVRAGVFNIFDKKYATWDDVRSIAMYGHANRVDENGSGLSRFTAPRRNFAVSLEAKF